MNSVTVSTLVTSEGSPARFGFVITKKVGNAVVRNLVRRRLKAVARELVDGGLVEVDVVARVQPAAVNCSWTTLRHELVMSAKGGKPG